jgi:arylsulfatase A
MNPRPNIVFLLADDTGYGDPGCYNPESMTSTPSIDRIAAEGIRFTDAHASSALCTPSRYGILTGRYYWRTPKKHALVMPYEPPVIEPDRVTIASMLKARGYRTGCIGKWHLGLNYPNRDGGYTQEESRIDFSRPLGGGPIELGFDTFFGTAGCSTSDPPYCFIENDRTVGIPTVPSGDDLHALPGFYPGLMAPDWSEEETDLRHVEKAIEFIDGGGPFFLYLALSAPHNPWLPPDFLKGASAEGPRGDMNALVDWCVGTIYSALEERGLLDDTLFIVTSDNGPMRGQNGHRSAGYLRGFKNTAFEGGHRVPFVARWPGAVPEGAVSDEPISLIDMMATFAALTGASMPTGAGEDTYNVLPALLGRGIGDPARPAVIADTGGATAVVGDFGIRVGKWKLVIPGRHTGDPEVRPEGLSLPKFLFDMERDPYERDNLIDVYPSIVQELEYVFERMKRT